MGKGCELALEIKQEGLLLDFGTAGIAVHSHSFQMGCGWWLERHQEVARAFLKAGSFGRMEGNQTTHFDPHKEKWDHSPSQSHLVDAPKSLLPKKE